MGIEDAESKLPITSDPTEFINNFLSSPMVAYELGRFKTTHAFPEETSDQDITSDFYRSDEAENLVLDFAAMGMRFQYDPQNIPEQPRGAIGAYLDHTTKMQDRLTRGVSATDHNALEAQKKRLHNHAARLLVQENIVPSVKIGRGLIKVILGQQK